MAHRWDEIPKVGQGTPRFIIHWIEDVATGDSQISLKDKV
jgi:hypothetical protein